MAANANKVLSISAAGVLVALMGPGVALLVDAVTFAVSAVSLAGLMVPEWAGSAARRGLWRDLREGAAYVGRTGWLWALLGYQAALLAVVVGPHMVAGPVLAERVYGGAGAWALIGVVQAVGSLAGGTVALRWRPRRPLAGVVAAGLGMVPYLLLYAAGAPLWLVSVAALLVGAQGAWAMAMQATLLQTRVPEAIRSRVASWAQLGGLVLMPLALAVAGPVAAAVGGGPVLLAGAVWLVVSTAVVLALPVVRTADERVGASGHATAARTGSPAGGAVAAGQAG
jgi:hypothetical protein